MRRLYEKNQLRHFLVWLAIYLVISIVAINLGANLGLALHAAAVVPLGVFSLVLFLYLRRTGIGREIGLGGTSVASPARLWFYLPLLALVTVPLVTGVREDLTLITVVTIAAWTVFVGFLEEVLMRGMLLQALLRTWRPVWALLLTAATFGAGHMASLAIGQSSADTVLQVLNATIVGLLLTLVVVATGNLHAAIVTHVLYNTLTAISQVTDSGWLIVPGLVTLVVYGGWLLYGAGVTDRLRALDAQRCHTPAADTDDFPESLAPRAQPSQVRAYDP